jgi:hypothetical protein
MSPKKIATLNLRIDPDLKEAARVAAQHDHRSVANLIEMLIRRHCEAVGIPIPEQSQLFDDASAGESGAVARASEKPGKDQA